MYAGDESFSNGSVCARDGSLLEKIPALHGGLEADGQTADACGILEGGLAGRYYLERLGADCVQVLRISSAWASRLVFLVTVAGFGN
jgi:hypothetical protein